MVRKLSWKVGNVEVANPLVLAPMEGVNCASFRVLCKRAGAGLIYTDMVDTKQFLEILKASRGDEETTVRQVVNPQREERPLVIQIGGGNGDELAHVTQILTRYADILDLNLGCPRSDMLGRKGGCYLMKHPNVLEKLLPSLTDNATVPLTAKIRSGWDLASINAVEVAQLFERHGFSAIAIHARTREQRYRNKADWNVIRAVKEAVRIPVIGNGDVTKPYHAVTMFGQTTCDAVMIARGAMGDPSIFSRTLALLATGKELSGPTREARFASFREFVALYSRIEHRNKLSELQDHASWWVAGLDDATALRERIRRTRSEDDLQAIFTRA